MFGHEARHAVRAVRAHCDLLTVFTPRQEVSHVQGACAISDKGGCDLGACPDMYELARFKDYMYTVQLQLSGHIRTKDLCPDNIDPDN